MKRLLVLVAALAVLVVFGLLAWLNPGSVDFRFLPSQSIRLPLGWLLIFAFVGGVVVTMVLTGLQQLGRRLASWGERRRAKQAVRLGEWQESGAALAWDGDLERGRNLLRKAWRRQPRSGAAALALASSYMDTGEYATARQILETAVAHDANDPDLRYALGETLRRSGEPNEAIRMLETVRVQHPRAPRALVSLRRLYRETGQWKEAADVQEAYLQTLSDGDRAAEQERLLHLRYQAAMSIGAPKERAEKLAVLLQDNRSFVPAAVSYGDALLASDRPEEAARLWEKSFKSMPRLVFIERLLSLRQGDRERERVVALMQKHRQQLDEDGVRLLTAQVEIAHDDLDKAAGELEAIGHQDAPAVQHCWAQLFHQRGQLQEAWKALSRAAAESGVDAGSYRCTSCGRCSDAWIGYCPACERFDTYRSGAERTGR
jgi:tetratricopeptide (TPR) repeat protein